MAGDVGHGGFQAVAQKPVEVSWSAFALRDLDRVSKFLLNSHPQIAREIAEAIISAADALADLPMMGRPIAGQRFRQVVIRVRNASYVLRYRAETRRVVILRVFHGREERS